MSTNAKMKFILELLIVSLLSSLILGMLYNKKYEVCAGFQTQVDAMKAYQNGATQLDRDNDGHPCENLAMTKKYYK